MAAGPAREEGLDPGNEVVGDAPGAEGLAEDVGIHIVKPTFDVQEERGELEGWAEGSAEDVDQGRACVEREESAERATLIGVKKAHVDAQRKESGSSDSLNDLGDCLEKDDDSERGWGVVGGVTRFTQ